MKIWQFFLTLGGAVGITYVTPALLALYLARNGVVYPWNAAITLMTMTAFVALLVFLCIREERLAKEKAGNK